MADEVRLRCALPADELLFRSMAAREELGRLPEYRLELLRPCTLDAIPPEALLGKAAGVSIRLDSRRERHVHGMVTQMERGGVVGRNDVYRLVLHPWLWQLTLGADFRVFQDRTVVQILDTVFAEYGAAGRVDKRLTGDFTPRPYTVQYRESDYDFVSRLMEDAGIYHYFRHEEERHTLVLCNGPSGHDAMDGDTLDWSARQAGQVEREDIVTEWSRRHSLQPLRYAHTDFAAEQPAADLRAEAQRSAPYSGYSDPHDLEVFDYPGRHDDLAMAANLQAKQGDGRDRARREVDRYESRHSVATGVTPFRSLMVGRVFAFASHGDAGRWLVTSSVTEVLYQGNDGNTESRRCNYSCRFDAVPAQVAFQPQAAAPRPVVRGPETALVVGPAGDEIHTDRFGRVKLQFHWDRLGRKDEKSSCWVRVSQPWAGSGFGMSALPRIGQEVIVDFLDGDPDRPLVTGRVHNGDNLPPWDLPGQATVSGIKTRSSKGGAASDANELRFDDRQGAEYLWLQARRDLHQWVLHDAFETVKNDARSDIARHATRHVGQDLEFGVGRDARLRVGGDTHATLAGDLALGVGGAFDLHAAGAVGLQGDAALALSAGQALDLSAGATLRLTAGGALHLQGLNVVIDGGTQLCLKAGGAFITLGPDGVCIVGTSVRINQGGAADVALPAMPPRPVVPQAPAPLQPDRDPLAGA